MPARNRRLPRHLSWPLTPTDIRDALGEQEAEAAELSFADQLVEDGTLLYVWWIPPRVSNYGNGFHPSLWYSVQITVCPLPATERAAARHTLRQHALPELRAWIDTARQAPESWTLTEHWRSWRLTGGGAAVVHSDDWKPYPDLP
ncbi:hypothetical protein ACFYNZ_17895 [Streptomyces kebangsaanensis]|uniref:Uncharacterized protein n=1 Tax=Streptomyces kebangsaanensis TaxID=864058 RepID=A0ABW6KTZ2_9ACTN